MRINLIKLLGIVVFGIAFTSCGSLRATKTAENKTRNVSENKVFNSPPQNKINTASPEDLPEDNRVYQITSYALDFEGTPYKYGGTTKAGMDCSGLVYTSFLQENIPLPRTSRAMSLEGERLSLVEVNIGDLLFFSTDKNQKVINHVGLVVEIRPGHILFIHSSTSRGVIISSLAEDYWHENFIMARRII